MSLNKYISALIPWLITPYCIVLLLLKVAFPQYYFAAYPFIILVFAGMGLMFYSLLLTKPQMPQRLFYMRFMINMFSKLFTSLLLIVLYVSLIKRQIIPFVVIYVGFYIVLSVFETRTFVQLSKKANNNVN